MLNENDLLKTIRLLVVSVLVAGVGACSRSGDEAAAPGSTPAAVTAPVPANNATPPPAPAEIAPLAPELAARLVRFHSPVLGRANAPVTVVEVLDPACGACAAFAPVMKQILFIHPDEVRVVVRYAAFHPGSDEAIRVLDAARRQGKFDQTLSALFDRQEEWASHAAPNPAQAWQIAAESGVDLAKARKDGRSASVDGLLRQESEDIAALQVEQTPTFFVNGKRLPSFNAMQLFDYLVAEVRRTQEARPTAQ